MWKLTAGAVGGAYALMAGGFLFGMCRAASLSEVENEPRLRLVPPLPDTVADRDDQHVAS